ncbi:MAG: outer membrane protein assembly factor BamD, partial [Chitinispirillaceae bacterium]
MKLKMLLTVMMCVIMPLSLSFGKDKEQSDKCLDRLHKALRKYENQRYHDTRAILDEAKYQCSGHPAMDSILYYLGMSLLQTKSYMEARVEFERLVQDHPRSAFAEEAHFRVGLAAYKQSNPPQKDQAQTHVAIRALSGFIHQRPESEYADSAQKYVDMAYEKLAEKEYHNARFYEQIEKYESAVVYLRDLIERYPESKYIPQAQLALAQDLIRISRPSEAKEVLETLLAGDPPKQIKRKARQLLKEDDGEKHPPQKQQKEEASPVAKENNNSLKDFSPPVIDESTESTMMDSPEDADTE